MAETIIEKPYNESNWINIDVDTTHWENYSWERLAYKKVGCIIFVHGGGTVANKTEPLSNYIISNSMPKPRQNTIVLCPLDNVIDALCKVYITNEGIMHISTNRNVPSGLILNFSYIGK